MSPKADRINLHNADLSDGIQQGQNIPTNCSIALLDDLRSKYCRANLVEDLQEPGSCRRERAGAPECIPDGESLPNQLVSTRGVHGVDAHV